MNIGIAQVTEEYGKQWSASLDLLNNLFSNATAAFQPYKCLVEMCERLMISAPRNQVLSFKSLTQDIRQLELMKNEHLEKFNTVVSPLVAEYKLMSLLELND
jgi:hypothetical protein